jgi:hypothetical protein
MTDPPFKLSTHGADERWPDLPEKPIPMVSEDERILMADRPQCDAIGCTRLADWAYVGPGEPLNLCRFHGGNGADIEDWIRVNWPESEDSVLDPLDPPLTDDEWVPFAQALGIETESEDSDG